MASDGQVDLRNAGPLSLITNAPSTLCRTITATHIARLYQHEYGIDVAPYLDVDEIKLFRWQQTGYEFFTPASIAGPPALYAELAVGRVASSEVENADHLKERDHDLNHKTA